MHRVPTEVIHLILQYIEPTSSFYSTLALVSKELHTIGTNDTVWKMLLHKQYPTSARVNTHNFRGVYIQICKYIALNASRKTVLDDNHLNICMVGSNNTGKSALTVRYATNVFVSEYDPTIEDYHTVETLGYRLDIYDTPTPDDGYWNPKNVYLHVKMAHLIMLTLSMTDRSSLEDLESYYNMVRKYQNEKYGTIPIVLAANKYDLKDEMVLHDTDVENWAKLMKIPFFFTSAKTKENVNLAFETLIKLADDKYVTIQQLCEKLEQGDPINIPEKPQKNKKCNLM